jgi:hypothetical protein
MIPDNLREVFKTKGIHSLEVEFFRYPDQPVYPFFSDANLAYAVRYFLYKCFTEHFKPHLEDDDFQGFMTLYVDTGELTLEGTRYKHSSVDLHAWLPSGHFDTLKAALK